MPNTDQIHYNYTVSLASYCDCRTLRHFHGDCSNMICVVFSIVSHLFRFEKSLHIIHIFCEINYRKRSLVVDGFISIVSTTWGTFGNLLISLNVIGICRSLGCFFHGNFTFMSVEPTEVCLQLAFSPHFHRTNRNIIWFEANRNALYILLLASWYRHVLGVILCRMNRIYSNNKWVANNSDDITERWSWLWVNWIRNMG